MATKKTPLSLKGRALALLAQREHSATELRRKLLRHAHAEARAALAGASDPAEEPPSEHGAARVDAVVDWLRANRYLSEERFVESRVHARVARYGNLRIRQELAQHGLNMPAEMAQALKDSELQRAAEVQRRKFGALPADAAEHARQARFLAQRGFASETIARVLRPPRG
jgi:regulatory protein